jgi:hypothetical protein
VSFGAALGVYSVSKPTRIGRNSWNAEAAPLAANPAKCRHFGRSQPTRHLLAMQKVVGSNPISRLRKGLHLQVFFVLAVG